MPRLLLIPLAAALLTLAACTSSSTSRSGASPSPHAAASPTASVATNPVSIQLSSATAKRGETITITGSGFNAQLATSVVIVQNGKVISLVASTVNVKSDGSFVLPTTIPVSLAAGPATINACSYNAKSANPNSQCSSQPITLS